MKATTTLAVSRIASTQAIGIVTLSGGSLIASRDNKYGSIVATLSRKQFGAEKNLKGQALKREYATYRRGLGVDTQEGVKKGSVPGQSRQFVVRHDLNAPSVPGK